jgi:hypothetical protein
MAKSYWVTFKYEKLPIFCFNCGRTLHGEKGCTERKPMGQHVAVGENQWAIWLRANMGRQKFGVQSGGSTG